MSEICRTKDDWVQSYSNYIYKTWLYAVHMYKISKQNICTQHAVYVLEIAKLVEICS